MATVKLSAPIGVKNPGQIMPPNSVILFGPDGEPLALLIQAGDLIVGGAGGIPQVLHAGSSPYRLAKDPETDLLGWVAPWPVTVQSAPPDLMGAFIAPLVFDNTASTGGLFAWDGGQYVQIGLATS